MEIMKFKDIEDVYGFMSDIVTSDSKNITAVLFYEQAEELMRLFLEDLDVTVGHIEIGNHDYSNYSREYYVSIDSDLILDVCPVMPHYKQDFGYVPIQEADIILYDESAKQSIVRINDCKESYQIEFGYDEDECGNCCNDCCSCSKSLCTAIRLFMNLLNE